MRKRERLCRSTGGYPHGKNGPILLKAGLKLKNEKWLDVFSPRLFRNDLMRLPVGLMARRESTTRTYAMCVKHAVLDFVVYQTVVIVIETK